jgi:hydrogenase maturation protease
MIKVFGIGNPLLMDDGVGIEVTKRINENDWLRKYITEIYVDDALDHIDEEDYIVIIDAVSFGGAIGELHILPFEDCRKYMNPQSFCHNRSLLSMLLLDLPQIKGELIGIEICCVAYEEGLSASLEKALPMITKEVNMRLVDMRSEEI